MKISLKKLIIISITFISSFGVTQKEDEKTKQKLLICSLLALEVNSNNSSNSRNIATNSVVNFTGCVVNYENERK